MVRLPLPALAPVLALLVLPLPAQAGKRLPRTGKAVAEADRELVAAEQERDAGRLDRAFERVRGLLERRPADPTAHRLYQELAALSRRDGRLVEAEYRHWLDEAPGDALRIALHASAELTAVVTDPTRFTPAQARDLDRRLTAAQADGRAEVIAHLVAADLEKVRGRVDAIGRHLRAAHEAAPGAPLVRYELIRHLVAAGESVEQAAELCAAVLRDTPWRVTACAPLFGWVGEDGARAASDLGRARQDELADRIEALETERKDDLVTLRAIEEFYGLVGEDRGRRRVRGLLAELDPQWQPPLQRSPYLRALPGGELTTEEMKAIEAVRGIVETNAADAAALVRRLEDFEPELPDSPRVEAIFHQTLGAALRDPTVGRTDEGRKRMRRAMEVQPDEPQYANAWAYTCALDEVHLAEALQTIDRALAQLLGKRGAFHLLDLDIGESLGDWETGKAESVGAYVDTKGWLLYRLGRHGEAVQFLTMASLLTTDGTIYGHLGRATYAVGNDEGAFSYLLRALAMGTEEEDVVRGLAEQLYERTRVVAGGLPALIREQRRILGLDGGGAPELGLDSGADQLSEEDLELLSKILGRESGAPSGGDPHRLLGESAPELRMELLAGGEASLADFRGQVVILDFWASWCGPCRTSLPRMAELAEGFAGQPVAVLGVSVDDSMDAARSFWREEGGAIRIGLAAAGVQDAYDISSIPATFVIDQEGVVASFRRGWQPGMDEVLRREVAELLAD